MPDPTPEELQDALSKRYVDAARVVLCESGRFIVFSMARGDVTAVAQAPDELEAGVRAAIARSAAMWEASRKAEREMQELLDGGAASPVAATAGDLGL